MSVYRKTGKTTGGGTIGNYDRPPGIDGLTTTVTELQLRRDMRAQKTALFRQVNDIWEDLALELMVYHVTLQRWSIEHGGKSFPAIKALTCNCHAHNVVKSKIRDHLAIHAPKPATTTED